MSQPNTGPLETLAKEFSELLEDFPYDVSVKMLTLAVHDTDFKRLAEEYPQFVDNDGDITLFMYKVSVIVTEE